ncbi:MAG TPA: Fe-S cluster assembly protein SufB, partial [Acholeplasma sp.]|nr:Fe-S cluster assembly protein SufB [Acholeplasma sp.]
MDDTKKKIDNIVGEYQFGFVTDAKPVMDTGKGINEDIVKQISTIKKEVDWMTNFRLKAYKQFQTLKNPDWGPDLSFIDFDSFTYYIKPSDRAENSWDDVPEEIKYTFERLGIPQAERNY